jgi:D-amino-acid dehydrogenase
VSGVVGLSAAVELVNRGFEVVVLEKNATSGYGCSYGNAGWITPCFAMPLPMPGMFFKALKWLMDAESPLYIKPDFNPLLFSWLWRFMLSMRKKKALKSVEVLVKISNYSLDYYKKLNEKFPNEFNFKQNGLLMVSQTKEGVKTAVEELSLVEKHDVKGKVLTPEEITKLEPSLIGNIQGGVYFTDDAHAEPLKVVKTLEKLALSLGVKIITNCEVYDFKVSNNKIHSLLTTKGEIAADLYVLATASWSVRLAKILKLNVPILGGKGYAIITDPLEVTPKIPLMLVEKKIAITPRENTLRIAGTLELVDQDDSITTRRVEAIIKGTRQFLRLPQNPKTYEIWRGLRPCTPDGVPMIGKSHKHENLYLCTGHQMLGLQSAPGSARLLGDLMTGSEPIVDPTPFRVSRF